MALNEGQLIALWLIAGSLLFCTATTTVVLAGMLVEIHREGERLRRRPRSQGWHEVIPPPEGLGGGSYKAPIERRDG